MLLYTVGFLLSFGLFSGFFFLWKIPLITSSGDPKSIPSISIIIPARNEEESLPILLESIQVQSIQPLDIIVVDDESSDRTAEIAQEHNATVLSTASFNLTQKGKSSACWIGAQKARGKWLVFLDSDTRFVHNQALESIGATYIEKNQIGLFSIQPYHETQNVYETFSAVLNIMVMAGLNRYSLLKNKLPHRGAFGPFLMTTQSQYREVGGHQAILNSHMDDIELAKLFKNKQLPVYVFGGSGSIHFRMFPEGIKQLVNGWTKSLIHGAKGTNPLIHLSIGGWITGHFLAAVLVIDSLMTLTAIATSLSVFVYLLYCIQFRWLMNKVGSFPLWTSFIPVVYISTFLILYLWAFVQVRILKKVKWRGREINT